MIHKKRSTKRGDLLEDAVVGPDGTTLCYQPYGREGLLIADVDLDAATGFLAKRYRYPQQ